MILSYSLISSLILGFGYLAYRCAMSGKSQHVLNRYVIIAIYAAAIILPFILMAIINENPAIRQSMAKIEIGELKAGIHDTQSAMHISRLLTAGISRTILYIYLSGMCVVTLYFLSGIIKLRRLIANGERIEYDGFVLILINSPKIIPFNWKHYVVINRADYLESGDLILRHELAHMHRSHWIDLCISRIVICLQWYNPAAWAMEDELEAIHEYQADDAVIASGVNMKEYQMLLIKKAVGARFQSFANSLNHSKLKKRITMMYQKKSLLKHRLGALILVPAIAAGCAVTSIPAVAGIIESLASTSVAVTSASKAPIERKIAYKSDVAPQFPGGEKELMTYLMQNIRYPKEAEKAGEEGKVLVTFTVMKDGSIGNVEVSRSVTPSLDNEAIRVIKEMPKWIPGKVNNNPADCEFELPIMFKLSSPSKANKSGK